MYRTKSKPAKAFMVMAIWLFCCPALVMAAAYIVIDVMPADGTSFSKGYGINNLAQIVGRTYNLNEITQEVEDLRALFWDFRNGSIALDTLDGSSGAWGVNDTGMACGFASDLAGYERAVRWNLADGSIIDLGTLTNPNTLENGNESYAYRGINNYNTVVGHAEIPNDAGDFMPYHGFIYDDTNGIQDLGTLNPDTYYMGGYSIGYDINDANVVVGITHTTGWNLFPFVWTEIDGMSELPIDGSIESGEWYATATNESGLIGGSVIAESGRYPYYWPSKDEDPIALVMLPAYPYGEIYGLNESGQMVGGMFDVAEQDRAFIFDGINGVVDLNDLINPGSAWELLTAIDINDNGQITGIGLIDGGKRAFLLTPNADTDMDDDIDGSDIAQLAQEFGTACGGSCASDFNDDDAVDTIDLLLLSMVFGYTNE